MIGLELLEKIEALQGLDDDQLIAVQGCTHKIEFQRGDRLFAEGEGSAHLWIELSGEIDLRYERPDDRQSSTSGTISFISTAELFGWSSFIPPYKYKLSAYCASRKCEMLKIEKARLVKLFNEDASMGFLVMSHIVRVIGTHFYQFRDEIVKERGDNIMSGW